MGRLFGTDGVRGVANDLLTCEMAMMIGRATGSVMAGRRRRGIFALGWDPRTSSEMLAASVAAGLCSSGADVIILGVIPTPAVAYLIQKYKCDGGIMISASHNGPEFNGIKVFGGEGYKIPDELEERIESLALSGDIPLSSPSDIGRIEPASNASDDYIEYLKSTVLHSLDGMRILLDCSNGAVSTVAERLFCDMGAEVTVIAAEPSGENINCGCGSTSIDNLVAGIKKGEYDGGAAFDGDGDRCIAVDSEGNILDGDDIMAVCALDMKRRGKLKKNTVVGTVMTNFGFGRYCRENGIDLVTTKVGDRYVLEEMLLGGFSLGGEQSGHIIFRDHSTTGDGLLTALQLFSLSARVGEGLNRLSGKVEKYPQSNASVHADSGEKLLFYTDRRVREAIERAENELGDRGRVVVRPSGTEPLIRIMAEGEDAKQIERITEELKAVLEALFDGEKKEI